MNLSKWKIRYYLFSFILSLYLLFSITVNYIPFSDSFKEINTKISIGILIFFIIELIVLFFMEKNKKAFMRENWITITAILVSLPFVFFLHTFAELGFIAAVNLMKAIKVMKFIKIVKLVKGVKVLKSIKLGKKTVKSIKYHRKTIKGEYKS